MNSFGGWGGGGMEGLGDDEDTNTRVGWCCPPEFSC